ncbi:MAG: TolC family protein [Polyangia bacterium]
MRSALLLLVLLGGGPALAQTAAAMPETTPPPSTGGLPELPPPAAQELQQQLLPKEARDTPLAVQPTVERVSLGEAVRRSLARNPTALQAQADIRRLIALGEQARAGSLPTLAATGSYTRLDNDRVLGVGDMQRLVAGANQVTGSVTVSQALIAPGRWAQWLHANDAVRVGQIAQEDVRRQLAMATARAYLLVVTQARALVVAERARDIARAHHDFALRRLRGGLGNRLDEARALQEFQTAEAQLLGARTALMRAQEALGVLAGSDVPLDSTIDGVATVDGARAPTPGQGPLSSPPVGTSAPAPRLADLLDEAQAGGASQALPKVAGLAGLPGLEEALDDALVLRTDLRLWQARAWAAARLVRHSWVDYMPTLSGSFSPFYQNPPSIVQPLLGWQARLDLSWVLFDGGARYGARHERLALYEQARLSVQAAQRQARSEVRVADEALRRSREAVTAAARAADAAAEAQRLATIAYRAGATNNLEVIDAERRARDAAAAAVQVEDQVRQAELDLLISSGRFPDAVIRPRPAS